jgi:hypothetical protein
MDRATLKDIWARYALYGDVLVQSRVMGHGVGLGLLARDGLLVNCFQYRRLHELPLTGGGSAYRVSETLDPVPKDQATQLVRQLGWHGASLLQSEARTWRHGSQFDECVSHIIFPDLDGAETVTERMHHLISAKHSVASEVIDSEVGASLIEESVQDALIDLYSSY